MDGIPTMCKVAVSFGRCDLVQRQRDRCIEGFMCARLCPTQVALSFAKASSIGERSGEYAGKYHNSHPAASMIACTRALLWTLRLSITTTCPGCNQGTR